MDIIEVKKWTGVALLKEETPGHISVILSGIHFHSNQWFDIKMHLVDALYLLSQLDEMSRESGFDPLWRPRE